MHTPNHPKSFRPVYKPGEIVGIDLDKHEVQLNFIGGDDADGWMEFNPEDQNIILSLYAEVSLLRKVMRELIRREGVHITSANEFNRGIASMAHKMNEDPEAIKELLTPYIKELVEQMLREPSSNGHGRNSSRKVRNRQRSHGGH